MKRYSTVELVSVTLVLATTVVAAYTTNSLLCAFANGLVFAVLPLIAKKASA